MYANQNPNNPSGKDSSRFSQRRGRNVTSQAEVVKPIVESNVYKIYPRNGKESPDKENPSAKDSFWKRLKTTVVETFEYLERRPRLNFGLFAIAQFFAGAGVPSLIMVGGLVIAMTVVAAQVYGSKEFVNQGVAICGGLILAKIAQLAVTILL